LLQRQLRIEELPKECPQLDDLLLERGDAVGQ
jgi:hypothetical protein